MERALLAFKEKKEGGRAMVTAPEEQVL